MRLTRLRLGDFGVFDDQEMADLQDGVVVVAGPNRAGKTTFMQALRYLAYPFPRTGELPPALKEYHLEADVVEAGNRYRIYRRGYGEPELVPVDHDAEASVRDLYPMDAFTYRQLFTLSLDELRRLPAGVGNKESRRLQSILLGAGLAEIAVIPEILKEFTKEAEKIGGKRGTPSVKGFRPHYEDIQQGLEERQQAQEQVEDYGRTRERLNAVRAEIAEVKEKKSAGELRRDRLDFLHQYYASFRQLQQALATLEKPGNQRLLEEYPATDLAEARRLAEEYPRARDTFEKELQSFRRLIDRTDWQPVMEQLLEAKQSLRAWERNRSGLEQRIADLRTRRDRHRDGQQQLRSRIRRLNADWADRPEVLDTLRIDERDLGELRQAASGYGTLTERIEDLRERLNDRATERDTIREQEARLASGAGLARYWVLGVGSVVAMGAGAWLGVTGRLWIGITAGAAGLLGLIFTVMLFLLAAEGRRERRRLALEGEQLDDKVHHLSEQIEERKQVREQRREILDTYRSLLDLTGDIHPETLAEYLREARDLKIAFRKWRDEEQDLRTQQQTVSREVESLVELLEQVMEIPGEIGDQPEESSEIFNALDTAIQWLNEAETLQASRQEMRALEERVRSVVIASEGQLDLSSSAADPDRIIRLLEEFLRQGEQYEELVRKQSELESLGQTLLTAFSDRVKAAFRPVAEIAEVQLESVVPLLAGCYGEFLSAEDIGEQLEKSRSTVNELEQSLEDLRDQRAKLEKSLEELATTERLEHAQAEIDRARSRLEPLAREYAVHRLAMLVLEKVRDRFLEKTRNELLGKASEFFHRLTSEDYTRILPPEDLESSDFLVEAPGGVRLDSTDVLSRGTQEQLFLAVRLSRIYELPSLPVILDDSLVNFDVPHRRQAAALVEQLAQRNQVFVLTCHPEIVEYLAETVSGIQYWTVDQGIVQSADYDRVKTYLTGSE